MEGLLLLFLMSMQTTIVGQQESVREVTWHSMTRGKEITVTMSRDSVRYHEYEGLEETLYTNPVTPGLFDELTAAVFLLDLPVLDELKAPTAHREYDGDWYTSVAIVTSNGSYSTVDFDRDCPVQEVKPILAVLKKAVNRSLYSENLKGCK